MSFYYHLFVVSFLGLLSTVSSLSCYTCDKEEWNWGGCTTNYVQCKPFQDTCTSYTSFSVSTKYSARAERYHSISKGCDTQLGCERRQMALDQSTCSRSSYADWSCVECCIGDLCNYYITLGTGALQVSFIVTILALVAQYFFCYV